MTVVWEAEDLYVDALDVSPCPRCRSPLFERDAELRAFICDGCGLYIEDDEPDLY